MPRILELELGLGQALTGEKKRFEEKNIIAIWRTKTWLHDESKETEYTLFSIVRQTIVPDDYKKIEHIICGHYKYLYIKYKILPCSFQMKKFIKWKRLFGIVKV